MVDRAMIRRRAFTMIEVLATLLLLALGLAAVIGLLLFALRLNARSVAAATAMATAWTALHDHRPGGRDPFAGDPAWQSTVLSGARGSDAYAVLVAGYLNGYYVRRVETAVPADRIDAGSRIVSVRVDVYDAEDGGPVAAMDGRLLRRDR
jgi:prepilin-type N-terminal cleavage/methylation domain-containing protein